MEDLNRVTKLAFWVSIIFYLLIAMYCFQSIKYTSEFAGWLLHGFNRIGIILFCSFFSFVFSRIVRLVCKVCWNTNVVFILSMVLLMIMGIGIYKISMLII